MAEPGDFPSAATLSTWTARLTQIRLPLWASLVLAIVVIVVFVWQRIAVGQAEARLESERQSMTQKFEADRSALLQQLGERVNAESLESKRQLGLALAWAVRGEMIRSNLDQIDQYFTEIVKLPHTERAMLADGTGTVRVSTDRRHLDAALATLVPAAALQMEQVGVLAEAGDARLLVIPVMGLNSRLGTVVVSYRQPNLLAGK